MTVEEVRASHNSSAVNAFLDDDGMYEITVRRAGAALAPERYRKLDGFPAKMAEMIGLQPAGTAEL